ncbi:MAG TPA: apolipoprotein N-acyltransferase [Gemmataceae bacterium]|nr:apolipoprotein N-acyltransferase [Gemmataceae bacterium]
MKGQAAPLQEKVSETVHSSNPTEAAGSPGPHFRPAGVRRPGNALVSAKLPEATWSQLALPALASAALLWSCYFPLAQGWLGWVALVPLLSLVRARASGWRLFCCAWLGGLAFFWPVLQWMRVADHRMYYTWAMLATYCSLYFPLAIWLLRRLDRGTGLPLILTVPIVWTGLEFVRSWLLTGFAWYYLGHTQHTFLQMIQIADIGGVYLISFVVAAVNAWLFEVLAGFSWYTAWLGLPPQPVETWTTILWRRFVQGTVVAGLIGGALTYGAYRLDEQPFTAGPRIALLQSNLDQRLRNAADVPGSDAQVDVGIHVENLSLDAKRLDPRPDLIVWPETSYPELWWDIAPNVPLQSVAADDRDAAVQSDAWMRKYATGDYKLTGPGWKGAIKPPPANILLGLNSRVVIEPGKPPVKYNSALLFYSNGMRGGRYDKIHRVPFGEYVPLRDWLPFMNAFAPYETDYSIRAGEHLTRLELGKFRFGVLICFEDTDPFLARNYGRATSDGPAVDFLVNISNDGWFDGSSEHDEHLAIARFRAIEARRSLARAVNMGISAVIDGNGRILAPTLVGHFKDPQGRVKANLWASNGAGAELPPSEWERFKKVAGVLTVIVPIDGRTSIYSLWGDWLPYSCWAMIAASLAWIAVRRRRASHPRQLGVPA